MFYSDSEHNLIENIQKRKTFLAGFDAAAELLSKQIEPLIEAINNYKTRCYGFACSCEYNGEEKYIDPNCPECKLYDALAAYKLKGSE